MTPLLLTFKIWLAKTTARWAGLTAVRPLPFSHKHGLVVVIWVNGDMFAVDFVTGKIDMMQEGIQL